MPFRSNFFPRALFWLADDGRIFSGPAEALVAATDPGYEAYLSSGEKPRVWPRDFHGNQTTQSLHDVIAPYGMFGSAQSYAASVRWNKVNGGVTYKGKPIATDDQSRANITAEALAAQVVGAGFSTAWKCSDGSWMPIPDAASMTAFATSVRSYVQACYAVEKTLSSAPTKAAVDAASWPSNNLT